MLIEIANAGSINGPAWRLLVDGIQVGRGSIEELYWLKEELDASPDKTKAIYEAFKALDEKRKES